MTGLKSGVKPGAVDVWRKAWPEFIPFLDYPPELRKIVYTTNAIESINFQLRKITKNRGHFPDKDAAMKLIYLGLRNISSQRGVAVQLVGGLVGWCARCDRHLR